MLLDRGDPTLYTFFPRRIQQSRSEDAMPKAGEPRSTPRGRSTAATLPETDQIARRAHELYEARGRTDGRDLDDWLQAERELQASNGRRKRKA
jgi:Protein of unknown function (DUF2934)